MFETILLVIFLVISVAIVALVLVQHGKGADMGASFGAGASATLFGSSGTGNFLTRSTSILGLLFFIVSLALANLSSYTASRSSDFSDLMYDDSHIGQSVLPGSSVQPVSPVLNGSSTSDIPE
ncbi:preprotein translocase subunit SecG [Utexia brackfieldae]|uniref:preprotein translocase subunit SecG n=1 Tax=Utexia brackfieldae TaxID=3074108 RepID=UPI00370D39E2